jgi:hypothetical protein
MLVATVVGWVLSACVGQLQFDPSQSSGAGGSIAVVSTGGSSGGSSGGTGGVVAAASCPAGFDVLTSVFKDKCGGCHGATAPTKNLDLVTAGVGARTVGVISTCNNKPLIATTLTSGQPTGHLLDKLAGPVTDCGVQMPAGGTPLSSTEMACVTDWALKAVNTASAGGGSY